MHEYVRHYVKIVYGLWSQQDTIDIVLTVYLTPCQSQNVHGIPFQWISLNSYWTPMDSPLSL